MECYDRNCKNRDLINERYIVLIRWHDACYQEGPIYIEDLNKDFILETVGFLIDENVESITLGMDWYSKKNYWRHIVHIPKGMIKTIIRIPIPKEFNKEAL